MFTFYNQGPLLAEKMTKAAGRAWWRFSGVRERASSGQGDVNDLVQILEDVCKQSDAPHDPTYLEILHRAYEKWSGEKGVMRDVDLIPRIQQVLADLKKYAAEIPPPPNRDEEERLSDFCHRVCDVAQWYAIS